MTRKNNYQNRAPSWRPMPADIEKVQELASKGLKPTEIAAMLKIPRRLFLRRLAQVPQMADAYELGNGLYGANLIEKSQELLDNRDPRLQYLSKLLIFKLKAYCMTRANLLAIDPELRTAQPAPNSHQHLESGSSYQESSEPPKHSGGVIDLFIVKHL